MMPTPTCRPKEHDWAINKLKDPDTGSHYFWTACRHCRLVDLKPPKAQASRAYQPSRAQ